jgi:tetratricopeptide (TPR) repeat protein
LEPQLAEFELRYAGQDYDTAANVLLDTDIDYIYSWGYYRLLLELYERLQNKIADTQIRARIVLSQGIGYNRIGHYQKAIHYFEEALNFFRKVKNRLGESHALDEQSFAYFMLAQPNLSIHHSEQALAITREIRDGLGECLLLGGLGMYYSLLGQTAHAIDYLEQALAISREIENQHLESVWLGNLGRCSLHLGQKTRAVEYHDQAMKIARTIGHRAGEGWQLSNLAEMRIYEGIYDEAIQHALASLNIGTEIGRPAICSRSNLLLALAYLNSGDLNSARQVAFAVSQYDEPQDIHSALALLGVITLRQGDRATAKEAFKKSITKADTILDLNNQNYYDAWDAKGLAYSCLTLCESSEHIPRAIEAYRAARALCKDIGIVNRVLRLFDALAVADEKGILAEVRKAAAGE